MAVRCTGRVLCTDPDQTACSGGNSAGYGAAIYCSTSSPVLTNCDVAGNSATTNGGGMFCITGSSPVITNSIFIDNNNYAIREDDATSDPTRDQLSLLRQLGRRLLGMRGLLPLTGAVQVNLISDGKAINNISGDPQVFS